MSTIVEILRQLRLKESNAIKGRVSLKHTGDVNISRDQLYGSTYLQREIVCTVLRCRDRTMSLSRSRFDILADNADTAEIKVELKSGQWYVKVKGIYISPVGVSNHWSYDLRDRGINIETGHKGSYTLHAHAQEIIDHDKRIMDNNHETWWVHHTFTELVMSSGS